MADPVVRAWISGCTEGHRRLETLASGVTDQVAARPSLLPGWTVGNVLTHLCRNADGHIGMLQAAQRGETIAQYPGGVQQREADIQAGHDRSSAELRADLVDSHRRLEQAWAETADEVWATGLGLMFAGPKTTAEQVFRRWREVEVHLIDLGLTDLGGPGWDALSSAYLDTEWEWILADLHARVEPEHTLVIVPDDRPSRAFGSGPQHVYVRASSGRILAWLLGRGGDASWPVLAPWS